MIYTIIMNNISTLEPHEVYAWFRGWHNRRQEYRRIFISNVMEECEEERNRIISTLSTYFGDVST